MVDDWSVVASLSKLAVLPEGFAFVFGANGLALAPTYARPTHASTVNTGGVLVLFEFVIALTLVGL